MNPADASLIDQVASQRLGANPNQPPVPPGQQQLEAQGAAAQASIPPQGNSSLKMAAPTTSEKATEALRPTEQQSQEPITYKVKFGDNDVRDLTESQIASTFNRYKDLNYKHQSEVAPHGKLLGMAQQVMQAAQSQGIQVSPDQVADFIEAATRAYVKNVQMGGQDDRPNTTGQRGQAQQPIGDFDASLKEWADKNAVDLPPGYAEMMRGMSGMSGAMQQMQQMIAGLTQGGQAGLQNANQQAIQAQEQNNALQRDGAMKQISFNLANAQQKYGLPDDAEQEFFSFAFDRGYTIEDFVDTELTDKVVQDYNNARMTPEMDRIRQIAQRRQAFTGAVEGSPVSGIEPARPTQDQSTFNSLLDFAQRKRG